MTTQVIDESPTDRNAALPAVKNARIGDNAVLGVDARELHAFLGNGDHYATWIRDRIGQYGFAEAVDFVTYSEVSEKGGRPRAMHVLTLDMAKEIAMVDRSEKGREVRRYFLECERRAQDPAIALAMALRDPEQARVLLLAQVERVAELQVVVSEMTPKVEAFQRIAEADGSLCVTDAAKALQMRPKDLFSYLREHGWIYKRPGTDHYLGYQVKVAAGLLEHKVTTVLRADGSEKITEQVRVTPKGLTRLAKLIQPVGVLVEAA